MSRASNGVRVIDLDIPFISLTWFFVKASLSMALAVALTSWIWVVIGSGMITLSAALVVGLGVPAWFEPAPVEAPATPPPPPVVVVQPPPPAPAPVEAPATPEPVAPAPAVDPNREATEAAMRAELERHRREKRP